MRLLWINLKCFSSFRYGSKYTRVLFTPRFSIYEGYEYGRILNMPLFPISQNFKYTGLTQATESLWISKHGSWIDLNMSENAGIFKINLIRISVVSLRSQFDILEKNPEKNLHFFCKMLYWRCLTGLRIWFGAWIYHGWEYDYASKYAKVLYIPGFWLCQDSQHTSGVNIWGLWKYYSS